MPPRQTPRGPCVVHVYGWEPGENVGILETGSYATATAYARKETRTQRGAFATVHVEGDRTVRIYARGKLSRRLAPPR